MITLYTELDEIREDEAIYTYGDDIAKTFYYGNFSDGVEKLKELNCRAKDFLDYLEDKADNYGCRLDELYNGHFSPDFWIALGSELY